MDADLLNSSAVEITLQSTKVDEPTRGAQLPLAACNPSPTFTGNISFQDGFMTAGNSVTEIRPGDLITMSYHDESPNDIIKAYIRFASNGTLIATPTMDGRSYLLDDTSLATVSSGQSFHLTVTDLDLDADPTLVDSAAVLVSSRQDSLNVVLHETDVSTGVFTASVCTSDQGAIGCLSSTEGVIVNATYGDLSANGNTVFRTARIRVASPGSLMMRGEAATGFEAGQSVILEVFDPDLNQLDDSIEQATVLLRAKDTEDAELVVLSETSLASSFFTGVVNTTVDVNSHDGQLLVETGTPNGGTEIEAAYLDLAPTSGKRALLKVCSPASVEAGPVFFVAGQNISITVTDADMQKDTLAQDHVNVSISTLNDTEAL
eukprot:1159773-Rhodomonas_salina.1